jgi:hypothetical protein
MMAIDCGASAVGLVAKMPGVSCRRTFTGKCQTGNLGGALLCCRCLQRSQNRW